MKCYTCGTKHPPFFRFLFWITKLHRSTHFQLENNFFANNGAFFHSFCYFFHSISRPTSCFSDQAAEKVIISTSNLLYPLICSQKQSYYTFLELFEAPPCLLFFSVITIIASHCASALCYFVFSMTLEYYCILQHISFLYPWKKHKILNSKESSIAFTITEICAS